MHKIRVFVNHRSSGGERAKNLVKQLERKLFRSEIAILSPQDLAELKSELLRAVAENVDLVVSVGGDGTVNTLIQTLGDTPTAFLIIPTGTANDLAREMGLLGKIDKAVQKIRNTEPEQIDLIKINHTLMATNGGIGIASEVAQHVNDLRKKFKPFKKIMNLMHDRIYSVFLGYQVMIKKLKIHSFEIECEEFQGRIHSPLIMINNQPALGGNFRIAPQTKNDDGKFNVTLFLHDSRINFAKTLGHIKFDGGPNPLDPFLKTFETSMVKVKTPEPIAFYGDGEILDFSNEFEIVSRPKALRVFGYRDVVKGFGDVVRTPESGVKV